MQKKLRRRPSRFARHSQLREKAPLKGGRNSYRIAEPLNCPHAQIAGSLDEQIQHSTAQASTTRSLWNPMSPRKFRCFLLHRYVRYTENVGHRAGNKASDENSDAWWNPVT